MFNEPTHMVNPGFPVDKSKQGPSAETWDFVKQIERGKFADVEGMSNAELDSLMRRLHDAYFDFPETREPDPLGIRSSVLLHSSRFKDAYHTIGALADNVVQEQNARSVKRDRLRARQLQRVGALKIFSNAAREFCEQMEKPLLQEFSYPEPRPALTTEDAAEMGFRELDSLANNSWFICRCHDEIMSFEEARSAISKLIESGALDAAISELGTLAENRRAKLANMETSRAVAKSELERRAKEAAAKERAKEDAPDMIAELRERIAELEKQAAGAC